MSDQNTRKTPVFELILAWGFVGIPLVWGIAMTLENAVKLF
ncbi:MAG: MFS transporter small subunit [Steroidobacteraceae bacterium]